MGAVVYVIPTLETLSLYFTVYFLTGLHGNICEKKYPKMIDASHII
jgi:hypothetical protein